MTPTLTKPVEVLNAQRKLGTENAETMTLIFEMLNSGVGSARILGINYPYLPASLMDRGIQDAIWYSDNNEIDNIIENYPLTRKPAQDVHKLRVKKSDLLILDANLYNEVKFPDRWVRSLFKRSANKYVVFYNVNTKRNQKEHTLKQEIENVVMMSLPEFELWRTSQHNFGIIVFKKK